MSRKSMQKNVMYNRQSKAWQQNQMKKQMAMAGYGKGAPKNVNPDKLKKGVIIGSIVLIAVIVLLTIKFHWVGLFIGLGVAVVASLGIFVYMRNKEKEILRYYKKMGIPKEEFFKQMKKNNAKKPLTKKQLDKMKKSWDSIK